MTSGGIKRGNPKPNKQAGSSLATGQLWASGNHKLLLGMCPGHRRGSLSPRKDLLRHVGQEGTREAVTGNIQVCPSWGHVGPSSGLPVTPSLACGLVGHVESPCLPHRGLAGPGPHTPSPCLYCPASHWAPEVTRPHGAGRRVRRGLKRPSTACPGEQNVPLEKVLDMTWGFGFPGGQGPAS